MSAAGGVPASGANWPGPLLRSTADAPGRLAIRSTAPLLSRSAATRRVLPAAGVGLDDGGPRPRAIAARQHGDRSVDAERHQIEGGVSGGFDRDDGADRAGVGHRVRLEGAAAQVQLHVDAAGLVEERGVGHALAVEVGPGEAAHARHAGEGLLHGEGAVAVVAQQHGSDGQRRRRQHDVEIAVGVGVGGPHGASRCTGDRRRQRRGLRDVGEAAVRALAQEHDAGARGDDEVGAEVVVEIRRQHGVGTERRPRPCLAARRSAARRSARRSAPASATTGVASAFATITPAQVASAAVPTVRRGRDLRARCPARAAPGLRVRQDEELLDRLADRVERRRDLREGAAVGRLAHQDVLQEQRRGSRRRAGWSRPPGAARRAAPAPAPATTARASRARRGPCSPRRRRRAWRRGGSRRGAPAGCRWSRAASRARAAPRRRSRACPAARSPAPARRPP